MSNDVQAVAVVINMIAHNPRVIILAFFKYFIKLPFLSEQSGITQILYIDTHRKSRGYDEKAVGNAKKTPTGLQSRSAGVNIWLFYTK